MSNRSGSKALQDRCGGRCCPLLQLGAQEPRKSAVVALWRVRAENGRRPARPHERGAMAGEIIYSVFVSSTYEDLREERAAVQKALLQLKCMPIGMELFGSAATKEY